MVIQVITEHEKREELIAILLRETTTLGVRFHSAERRVQARKWVEVSTAHGIVRIKESDHGLPRYEDARKIAYASGVPLKQVIAETAHAHKTEMRYYLTVAALLHQRRAAYRPHVHPTLAADTIKQFKRMQEADVTLTTGTDEHGQKVRRSGRQ